MVHKGGSGEGVYYPHSSKLFSRQSKPNGNHYICFRLPFFTVLVKRKISSLLAKSLFSHYSESKETFREIFVNDKKPWNSNHWHFDIIMHVPFNLQFLRCYVKGFFFPCQMRDEMRLDFFFCPFFQDIQCTLLEALIVLTSTLDWFQIEAISSLCTSTPLLFSKSEWPKSSLFSIEVNIP